MTATGGYGRQIVVLSPHPDDAVLSAWSVLSQGGVLVVTVFAGIPEPGFVTPLDEAHGAEDSASWAARRRREDSLAVGLAGSHVVHGDLLDLEYRLHRVPLLRAKVARDPRKVLVVGRDAAAVRVGIGEIDDALGTHICPGSLVYAPLGVGGHPDHQDVARYALSLAARSQVHLYADSPYYLRNGLPWWISAKTEGKADLAVQEAFDYLGLDQGRLPRQHVALDDAAVAQKLAAWQAYRTEVDPVDADFGGMTMNPSLMRHETYWKLT